MPSIKIKALSVNEAYKGRKFPTRNLTDYKTSLGYLLPKITVPTGKLFARYIFGTSSKGSDVDNLIKAFQDCLSEKYGFNDNMIYKIEVEKVDVKKGQEYISFSLEQY